MKGNDRVATVAAMTPEVPQPDTGQDPVGR